MTGTVWDNLRDFKLATGDHHILHDPRVVNLAGYNRYIFHTIFANNAEKSIQGGDEINFSMFFDVGETYEHPLPGAFRQYRRVDNAYEAKQRWAKSTDHKTWLRDEIVKNKSRGGKAWFDVFFDMDKKLEQRLQVSRDKGLENDLAAIPNYETMENTTIGANGILPASIFFHVNEDAFGCWGLLSNGTSTVSWDANVATTARVIQKQRFAIMGSATATVLANPTLIGASYNPQGLAGSTIGAFSTRSKYSPVQMRYTTDEVNSPNNIFGAMRSAFRASTWEGPTSTKQWYDDVTHNNRRMFGSDYACRVLETLVKAGQDRWVLGPQDMGIPEIQCFGIPVKWWPLLDEIPLYYLSSGVRTTEKLATNTGPRIYGIDFNTLYPVVHEGMWNYRESMPPHFNVPDVFVELVEDWWNTMAERYNSHFVVSPTGALDMEPTP